MPRKQPTIPTVPNGIEERVMYDLPTAAKLWGVPLRQLQRWVWDGKVTVTRQGGKGKRSTPYIAHDEIIRRTREWTERD